MLPMKTRRAGGGGRRGQSLAEYGPYRHYVGMHFKEIRTMGPKLVDYLLYEAEDTGIAWI